MASTQQYLTDDDTEDHANEVDDNDNPSDSEITDDKVRTVSHNERLSREYLNAVKIVSNSNDQKTFTITPYPEAQDYRNFLQVLCGLQQQQV